MSDLISRQAAIRWVKTECNPYGKPTLDYESGKKVMEHLEQMPSAEPEIIRCEDCRWWERESICEGHCLEIDLYHVDEDHYCGFAERRTDERPDRQAKGD
jgi:hypothetical protein